MAVDLQRRDGSCEIRVVDGGPGIPAEALVLEMYMSGEMEAVFQAFREKGFFKASEDHGPTAVFGGITRSLEMDREEMAARFRQTFELAGSGTPDCEDELSVSPPLPPEESPKFFRQST